MSETIVIRVRDPLIARDGRPFREGGYRMKSVDWFYPSVAAGSLRTLIGKQRGGNFDLKLVSELKHIAIAGPFPLRRDKVFFPSPKDIVVGEDRQKHYTVRPVEYDAGEGCDFREDGLRPALISDPAGEDFKPAAIPPFWSAATIHKWLATSTGEGFPSPPDPMVKDFHNDNFLAPFRRDERTHVKIVPDSGAAEETQLFRTVAIAMDGKGDCRVDLALRVSPECGLAAGAAHTMGGERRLAFWETGKIDWGCPRDLANKLREKQRIRMMLATPALFKGGWRPGWLDKESLKGKLPGTQTEVRLVSVCMDRWKAISGFSLDRTEEGGYGPKPARRMVPAGSIYFFEVLKGTVDAAAVWMKSVSDLPQDGRDGFGIALWGIW